MATLIIDQGKRQCLRAGWQNGGGGQVGKRVKWECYTTATAMVDAALFDQPRPAAFTANALTWRAERERMRLDTQVDT